MSSDVPDLDADLLDGLDPEDAKNLAEFIRKATAAFLDARRAGLTIEQMLMATTGMSAGIALEMGWTKEQFLERSAWLFEKAKASLPEGFFHVADPGDMN